VSCWCLQAHAVVHLDLQPQVTRGELSCLSVSSEECWTLIAGAEAVAFAPKLWLPRLAAAAASILMLPFEVLAMQLLAVAQPPASSVERYPQPIAVGSFLQSLPAHHH